MYDHWLKRWSDIESYFDYVNRLRRKGITVISGDGQKVRRYVDLEWLRMYFAGDDIYKAADVRTDLIDAPGIEIKEI